MPLGLPADVHRQAFERCGSWRRPADVIYCNRASVNGRLYCAKETLLRELSCTDVTGHALGESTLATKLTCVNHDACARESWIVRRRGKQAALRTISPAAVGTREYHFPTFSVYEKLARRESWPLRRSCLTLPGRFETSYCCTAR